MGTAATLGAAGTGAASDGRVGAGGPTTGRQVDGPPEPTDPNDIDPIFGFASAAESPCLGDASESCAEAFVPPVRPSHEVELRLDLPEVVLALGAQGVLSAETVEEINAAVADGTVDEGELTNPDEEVSVERPDGSSETLTVGEVAERLADALGFYFEPAGLSVAPGDVVLFSAETPDHGVVAYHARHGRQNRVPEGVGPVSSPLVPVDGYWLYRFDVPGVYDLYCPPHDPFGMVLRVVVTEGEVPEPSVEQTGRAPPATNALAGVFGGLDPNLPSSLDGLESAPLEPGAVVADGTVPWEAVVDAYRART